LTLAEFLQDLRERDIILTLDGDRLRCSAPPSVMTEYLRAELQIRKAEIISFLRTAKSIGARHRALIPLQPDGQRPPIFAVAGHAGDVFCYRALSHALGSDQPFYGLEPAGLDEITNPLGQVDEFAEYFATAVREFNPKGPFAIAGYCAGSAIAIELARRLKAQGQNVALLIMFGGPYPTSYGLVSQLKQKALHAASRVSHHTRSIASLPVARRPAYVMSVLDRGIRSLKSRIFDGVSDPIAARRKVVEDKTLDAVRRYRPQYFDGRLSIILPNEGCADSLDQPLRWRQHVAALDVFAGPQGCDGDNMLLTDFAPATARLVEESLQRVFRMSATNEIHGQNGCLK
jgi:thioesterase domain-containing protein